MLHTGYLSTTCVLYASIHAFDSSAWTPVRFSLHPAISSQFSACNARILVVPPKIWIRNHCVAGCAMGQSHVSVQLIHGFRGLHDMRAAMPHLYASAGLGLHIHVNFFLSKFVAPLVFCFQPREMFCLAFPDAHRSLADKPLQIVQGKGRARKKRLP